MGSAVHFDAVSLPLRDGWRLEWRRKGCTAVCAEVAGLPSGWLGVPADGGGIQVARGARGGVLRVNETLRFGVSVEAPPGAHPAVEFRMPEAVFTLTSREDTLPAGEFQAVNYLGVLNASIVRGGIEERLAVEVVSSKFSHDTDFHRMTEDIANECQQLLLAWNMPAGLPFEKDPVRRRRLLLEQFVFLCQELRDGRLERWTESIRMRPHEELRRESTWRPSGLVGSTHHLREPLAYGRDWRRTAMGQRPGEVLQVSKRPSLDTAPNRFLKHALGGFAGICREVIQAFHDPREGAGLNGPAIRDARDLLSRLDGQLGSGFFREVGEADGIPIANQTLQKREGYRDILRVWLLTGQAARLNWEGRDDVFNASVRNVAALYEYWLFFFLRRTISSLKGVEEVEVGEADGSGLLPAFCERKGLLEIRLKRGTGSLLAFDHGGAGGLRIHFCFDRTYSPTRNVLAGGAYSKAFRPDFSLVVFPAEFAEGRRWDHAERAAEAAGRIAYLHFDAKYRVDDLKELFPTDSAGLLDEEESGKATNTYRRADLYKMHTYNDAIRRTVGSYVLYPGNGTAEAQFSKYHELLPGLGAFAVSPSSSKDAAKMVAGFLEKVFAAQRDRFSQLARIGYWTHDTIREEPAQYHRGGVDNHARPPKDTTILLGFLRADEDPEDYRSRSVFFWHAVEWLDASLPADLRRPGVATRLGFDPMRGDLLGVYRRGISEPWLAEVTDVRIVSAEMRADELGRPLEAMRAAYYFRMQLGLFLDEPRRNLSPLVGLRPGKPVVTTLAGLAACEPAAS